MGRRSRRAGRSSRSILVRPHSSVSAGPTGVRRGVPRLYGGSTSHGVVGPSTSSTEWINCRPHHATGRANPRQSRSDRSSRLRTNQPKKGPHSTSHAPSSGTGGRAPDSLTYSRSIPTGTARSVRFSSQSISPWVAVRRRERNEEAQGARSPNVHLTAAILDAQSPGSTPARCGMGPLRGKEGSVCGWAESHRGSE